MTNRLLTLAVVLALAPSASAQSDPGGASAPLPPPTAVEDADPGGRSEALPAPTDVSDTDADLPSGIAVTRTVAVDPVYADGRDPSEPTLRVESLQPVGDPTDGRDPDEPIADAKRPAVGGPLANGREGGEARDIVADATPTEDTAAKTGDAEAQLTLSPVMPNPVRGRAALTFQVPTAGPATVTVFDLTGRRVATVYDDVAADGGAVRVELDLAGVAAGTYVAVLDTGRERVSRTFQVVR